VVRLASLVGDVGIDDEMVEHGVVTKVFGHY
jgi:hypothetical protein